MPWCRCQPYIVGVGLGYLLHHTRSGLSYRPPRWAVAAGWLAAAGAAVAVVYGVDVRGMLASGERPSAAADAAYSALYRLAWGAALAWVVFACSRGLGGFVQDLLSWGAFGPLGRVAFNVYLVHYSLAKLLLGQVTFPTVVTHLYVVR